MFWILFPSWILTTLNWTMLLAWYGWKSWKGSSRSPLRLKLYFCSFQNGHFPSPFIFFHEAVPLIRVSVSPFWFIFLLGDKTLKPKLSINGQRWTTERMKQKRALNPAAKSHGAACTRAGWGPKGKAPARQQGWWTASSGGRAWMPRQVTRAGQASSQAAPSFPSHPATKLDN